MDERPDPPTEASVDPRVTVVVVVYGDEPVLPACFAAIAASRGVECELVAVENGGSEDVIADHETRGAIRVVRPGRNTGFAEGCNLGAAAGSAPFVALINPDAVVEPDAIARLVEVASRPDVGIATASVRLADRPEHLNSAGTEINFLGLSWAGHFDEPAANFSGEMLVAAASGAAMVCRRSHWESLGGLVDEFFAYFEDAEFSIRTWQSGRTIVYVPSSIVTHRYEFSRNTGKFFLLERNRIATALTCFDFTHLAAIAPLAVAMEIGVLAIAQRHGWLPEKLRSYRWLWRERHWLRARRRTVRSNGAATPPVLYDLLTTSLTPGNLESVHPPRWIQRVATIYWSIARRLVGI